MKKIVIFLTLLILIGCNSTSIIDNKKLISKIHTLEIHQKIIELNLDENETIIDTSSITYEKVNSDGEKVFEKKTSFALNSETTSEKYFTTEGDLFYSKTIALKGTYESIYETTRNENEIINAILISIDNFINKDTITIDYDYKYKSGKIEKLIISTNSNKHKNITSVGTMLYDSVENPICEFTLMGKDTISKDIYIYKNGKLFKRESINNKFLSKISNWYSKDETLLKTESFIKKDNRWLKEEITEYFYDVNLNKTKAKNTDLINGGTLYKKYIIEKRSS